MITAKEAKGISKETQKTILDEQRKFLENKIKEHAKQFGHEGFSVDESHEYSYGAIKKNADWLRSFGYSVTKDFNQGRARYIISWEEE